MIPIKIDSYKMIYMDFETLTGMFIGTRTNSCCNAHI